jgi:hypothetical protein
VRELEAIKEIEAGQPLTNTEGLQPDLFVLHDGIRTTVVHELVIHNRLNELKALLDGKTAAEIQSILDVGFGRSWPLQCLVTYIISGGGKHVEFNYIDPTQYKDLICFLLQNGADATLVTMELLSTKTQHNGKGAVAEVINKILEIMEECAPDVIAASRATITSFYEAHTSDAATDTTPDNATESILTGVVEHSGHPLLSAIIIA